MSGPVELALAIVSLVACVGVLIAEHRKRVTFAGYEEIKSDVLGLVSTLHGEIFRQGHDLVVVGNNGGLSTTVHFSHQDEMPGVHIKMQAPSTFSLFCAPRSDSSNQEGSVMLRIPDAYLSKRFAVRSDHPTEARLFLGEDKVLQNVNQLCCSSQTFFSIRQGTMELSEIIIPEPYTGRHLQDHLQAMRGLLAAMRQMPGAHAVRVSAFKRERRFAFRAALAVGIMAALGTVIAARKEPKPVRLADVTPPTPTGITPADADQIPGLVGWRQVSESDFEPAAVSWLTGYTGQNVTSHIEGDLSGKADGRDSIYVLRRVDDTGFRVVILIGGHNVYDVTYDKLAIVARIPHDRLQQVTWGAGTADSSVGDAILLGFSADDGSASVVLFYDGKHIASAAPADYLHASF